jgi:hypothetical protein
MPLGTGLTQDGVDHVGVLPHHAWFGIYDTADGPGIFPMNRRGFLRSLGALAAGFSILPSATLYTRTWKATEPQFKCFLHDVPPVFDEAIISPEWESAPYEIAFIMRAGSYILEPDPYPRRFKFVDGSGNLR